ncbi:hypothetical protein K438DRAFT_1750455 [Mycena galopus ATCC 62051]|nr:hypothetical protein K438DRAFT_1750455 [Mycena galopus ATCC 62051]
MVYLCVPLTTLRLPLPFCLPLSTLCLRKVDSLRLPPATSANLVHRPRPTVGQAPTGRRLYTDVGYGKHLDRTQGRCTLGPPRSTTWTDPRSTGGRNAVRWDQTKAESEEKRKPARPIDPNRVFTYNAPVHDAENEDGEGEGGGVERSMRISALLRRLKMSRKEGVQCERQARSAAHEGVFVCAADPCGVRAGEGGSKRLRTDASTIHVYLPRKHAATQSLRLAGPLSPSRNSACEGGGGWSTELWFRAQTELRIAKCCAPIWPPRFCVCCAYCETRGYSLHQATCSLALALALPHFPQRPDINVVDGGRSDDREGIKRATRAGRAPADRARSSLSSARNETKEQSKLWLEGGRWRLRSLAHLKCASSRWSSGDGGTRPLKRKGGPLCIVLRRHARAVTVKCIADNRMKARSAAHATLRRPGLHRGSYLRLSLPRTGDDSECAVDENTGDSRGKVDVYTVNQRQTGTGVVAEVPARKCTRGERPSGRVSRRSEGEWQARRRRGGDDKGGVQPGRESGEYASIVFLARNELGRKGIWKRSQNLRLSTREPRPKPRSSHGYRSRKTVIENAEGGTGVGFNAKNTSAAREFGSVSSDSSWARGLVIDSWSMDFQNPLRFRLLSIPTTDDLLSLLLFLRNDPIFRSSHLISAPIFVEAWSRSSSA